MRKALTITAIAALALSAVMVSAPHRAQADTNGICLLNPEPATYSPSTAGNPMFPACTPDRRVEVVSLPDPSSPPTNVNVISMPSSAAYPTPPAIQPVSAPTNLPVVNAAAKYTVLSSAGTTTMAGAKVFIGAADASTSAQVTAVTCYDNASTASGAVLLNTVLGLTNPWFPSGGIGLTNGLTCNVPLALLGNGVLIYWRTF